MLKIEKGGVYTAARVRNGSSEKGEWELLVVKEDGKAHRELVIFARNAPSGVREGELFTVKEILSAGPRRTKNQDGTWSNYEKTSVEAEVEPVVGLNSLDDLDELDSLDELL